MLSNGDGAHAADFIHDIAAQWDMAEQIQKGIDTCCGHADDVLQYMKTMDLLDTMEEVAKGLRVDLELAPNPLTKTGFMRMEARAIRKLQKASSKANSKDLKKLEKLISKVDPSSAKSVDNFITKSADILDRLPAQTAKQVAPVLSESVEDMYRATRVKQINKLFRKGKTRTKDALERFGFRDQQVVDMLNKNHKILINDGIEAGVKGFQKKSRAVLTDALERNLPQAEVTASLQKAMGTTVGNENYWNVVGSSWMNRSRNWSNLETFNDAGIKHYKILAILDERTSPVCRSLNGKRFGVKKQISILEKASQVTDLDQYKKEVPWLRSFTDEEGQVVVGIKQGKRFTKVTVDGKLQGKTSTLQNKGFAMPPFHGLCRTTVVDD
ncbi:MAG: minor capsid protein [Nitrosomonadaceae bacterium]